MITLSRAAPLLALALLTAPDLALANAPAQEGQGDPMIAAKQLYRDGRYLDSARAFEQIYRTTGNTNALFNAGMAREAAGAGHEAHAIHDWSLYLQLAPAVPESERADLQRRLDAAARNTAPVEILYDYPADAPDPRRVELHRGDRDVDPLIVNIPEGERLVTIPLSAGPWTARVFGEGGLLHAVPFNVTGPSAKALHLRLAPAAPEETPVSVRLGPERALSRGIELRWEGPGEAPSPETTNEAERSWKLAPGPWVLHAQAKGFRPERLQVDVDGVPSELELRLRRHPDVTARIALGAVSGAIGVGLVAAGGVVWSQGRSDFEKNKAGLDEPTDYADGGRRLVVVTTLYQDSLTQLRGLGLAAGGLGAGVVSITEAAGGGRRARFAELGIGAPLAVAGLVAIAQVRGREENRLSESSEEDELTDWRARLVPGYSLLGAGAGMASASLVAIITHAAVNRRTRPRTAAAAAPLRRGLMLSVDLTF